MATQFVLIDFENVQPSNLDGLSREKHHIRVFVGAGQSKISFETARALQAFGDAAEYVRITGTGRNALDFHIAYYLGRLSHEHPGAKFVVISKDTGFDPLVKHLGENGIDCRRVASVEALTGHVPKAAKAEKPKKAPKPQEPAPPAIDEAVVNATIERLHGMGKARPRTLKTLGSSVKAWHKLDDKALASLVLALTSGGTVKVEGKKLTYRFD